MSSWILENRELISISTSILVTVFTIVGAIAIPIVLFKWSKKSEEKKESREEARIERDKQEQIRREEQKYLISYIEKYLYSTYDDYFNFEKIDDLDKLNDSESLKRLEKHSQKLTYVLETKLKKLAAVNVIIENLSYNYLREYFNLLTHIVSQSLVYKWKNWKNFVFFHNKILETMPILVSIVLMEKEQFERMKKQLINTLIDTSSDEEKYVVECAIKEYNKEQSYLKEQEKILREKNK